MIVELIQSDGWVNVSPDDFVHELFEITGKSGIHKIVNEVYTGYGKSGEFEFRNWYNCPYTRMINGVINESLEYF